MTVLVLVGFAVVLGPVTPACACSCAPTTPQESLADADAVFVGVVRSVHRPWRLFGGSSADPVDVTIDVSLVHKSGSAAGVPATVQVRTAAEGASCGYDFQVGRHYLVFVRDSGAELRTSLCDGNRDLALEPDPFVGGEAPVPVPPESSWSPLVIYPLVVAGGVLLALAVTWLIRRRARPSRS